MHPAAKIVGLGWLLLVVGLSLVFARDIWVRGGGGPFAGPESLLAVPVAPFSFADPRVGDLDADGVPDLLLSSRAAGFFAQVLSGATGEPILHLRGFVSAREGRRAVAAGDCDGDGVGDVLVAHDGWGTDSGRVLLFSGADGRELFAWEGADGDRYGAAIAGPGDLDGDGVNDVVLGAPGAGYVEVRSGRDGSLLQRLEAPGAGTAFGRRILLLGDLDSDGHVELGIQDRLEKAARLHVVSTATWKRTLLLADAELGLSTTMTYATTDEDSDGVRDLLVSGKDGARIVSGADGTVLRELLTGMSWVHAVPLGDYDGDGTDDLLVRTLETNDFGWVLELNTYAAIRVVSGRTNEALFELWCPTPGPSMAGPVDLNGDGRGDFWVSFGGELRAYSR